jgi:hypothetical protein
MFLLSLLFPEAGGIRAFSLCPRQFIQRIVREVPGLEELLGLLVQSLQVPLRTDFGDEEVDRNGTEAGLVLG